MANRVTDFFKRFQEPEQETIRVGDFTLSADGKELIRFHPPKEFDGVVNIPEGVEYINQRAFQNKHGITYEPMENIREIHGPESLHTVATHTFHNNMSLEEVHLPGLRHVEEGAFEGCQRLRVAEMPEVEIVGKSGFARCYELQEVNIPNVREVGDYGYYECHKLQSATMGPDTIYVGKHSFEGCYELRDATIAERSNSIVQIEENAFARDRNLQNAPLPEGTVSIGDRAFDQCSSLQHVDIPSTVTEIGQQSFNRTALEGTIVLPESIEHVGRYAFGEGAYFNKGHVDAVVVPESALQNNPGLERELNQALKDNYDHVVKPTVLTEDNTVSDLQRMGLAEVNENGALTHIDSRVSGHVTIDSSITSVEAGAFEQNQRVQSVSIESNFTEIREGALDKIQTVQGPIIGLDEERMQLAERQRASEMEAQQGQNNVTVVNEPPIMSADQVVQTIERESQEMQREQPVIETVAVNDRDKIQVAIDRDNTVVSYVTPENTVPSVRISEPTVPEVNTQPDVSNANVRFEDVQNTIAVPQTNAGIEQTSSQEAATRTEVPERTNNAVASDMNNASQQEVERAPKTEREILHDNVSHKTNEIFAERQSHMSSPAEIAASEEQRAFQLRTLWNYVERLSDAEVHLAVSREPDEQRSFLLTMARMEQEREAMQTKPEQLESLEDASNRLRGDINARAAAEQAAKEEAAEKENQMMALAF